MTQIKKQLYLCVDLSTRMHDHDIRMGEVRKGVLTMVEDQEEFVFEEGEPDRCKRNPTVFEGEYINVHLDKCGALVVSLHRTELYNRKQAARDGEAIKTELLTAAKMLGL